MDRARGSTFPSCSRAIRRARSAPTPSSASATRISARTTARSYVYAQNEYREFLAFYPTNPRADYAQIQLGMVHFNQMLDPQRDQTETKEAIREFQTFVERYPNSPLIRRCSKRLREAKDRLADWDLQVGNFYLSIRLYPSAREQRFRYMLKNDPEYTRKDALYFYLAEALEKSEKKAEALPYYERLVEEFEQASISKRPNGGSNG